MKLILGMRKLHATVYDPNDSESCFKAFEKRYSYHAKIAQELKERNKYIYWTVIVIIVMLTVIWVPSLYLNLPFCSFQTYIEVTNESTFKPSKHWLQLGSSRLLNLPRHHPK